MKKKRSSKQNGKKAITPLAPVSSTPSANITRTILQTVLYLFVFMLPWIHFSGTGARSISYYFAVIWASFILGAILFYGIAYGSFQIKLSKAWLFLGTAFCSTLISTFASINPGQSIFGSQGAWADSLLFTIASIIIVASFLALTPKRQDFHLLIYLLLAQSALLGIDALSNAVEMGFPSTLVRSETVLANIDYLLSYVLLIIPLSCYALYTSWRNQKMRLGTWLLGIHTAIIMLTAFVCLPVGLQEIITHPFAQTVTNKPTSQEEISEDAEDVPVPVPVTVAATPTPNIENFLQNSSNDERFTQWELGLAIFKLHPWLGSGPSTIQSAFYTVFQDPALPMENWNFSIDLSMAHPHNAIIEHLATQGIVGLIAYGILFIALGWMTIVALWQKKITGETRLLLLAVIAGLVLYELFNVALFKTVLSGTIALLLLAGSISLADHTPSLLSPRPLKVLTLAFVGVFTLALLGGSYWNIRYLHAERNDTLAQAYVGGGDYFSAAQVSAKAAESFPYEAAYSQHASFYNRAAYMLYSTQPNREQFAATSLKFGKAATDRDPRTPAYLLEYGLAQYVTAAPLSKEEEAGRETAIKALAMSDPYPIPYALAGDAFYWKGDCAIALDLYAQGQQKKLGIAYQDVIDRKLKAAPCKPRDNQPGQ